MEDKKDYLFKDFSEFKVIEETRKDVMENPQKYFSYDARIRMGKFYTDEEYEKRVEEVLSRPLPGEEKGPKKILRIFKRKKK